VKALIIVISTVCGLPFLRTGLYEAYRENREIENFAHISGTVVGNSYATVFDNGNVSGAYLPVIEFVLPDERKIRFTDQVGSFPPDYEVGASLEIIYNSENPSDARINSWKRLWLVPIILIAVGSLPFIAGVIITRRLQL